MCGIIACVSNHCASILIEGLARLKNRGYDSMVSRNQSQTCSNCMHWQDCVQQNQTFGSLMSILPLQLLAYHLSVAKGLDPDFPRNLAKVVTVE